MASVNDIIGRFILASATRPKVFGTSIIEKFRSAASNPGYKSEGSDETYEHEILKPQEEQLQDSHAVPDKNKSWVHRKLRPETISPETRYVDEGDASHKLQPKEKGKTAHLVTAALIKHGQRVMITTPGWLMGKTGEVVDEFEDTVKIRFDDPVSLEEYEASLQGKYPEAQIPTLVEGFRQMMRSKGFLDKDDRLVEYLVPIEQIRKAGKNIAAERFENIRVARARRDLGDFKYRVGQVVEVTDLAEPELDIPCPRGIIVSMFEIDPNIPYDVRFGSKVIPMFEHEIRLAADQSGTQAPAQPGTQPGTQPGAQPGAGTQPGTQSGAPRAKDQPPLQANPAAIADDLIKRYRDLGANVESIKTELRRISDEFGSHVARGVEKELLARAGPAKEVLEKEFGATEKGDEAIAERLVEVIKPFIEEGATADQIVDVLREYVGAGQLTSNAADKVIDKLGLGTLTKAQLVSNKTPNSTFSSTEKQEQGPGTPAYGTAEEQEALEDDALRALVRKRRRQ